MRAGISSRQGCGGVADPHNHLELGGYHACFEHRNSLTKTSHCRIQYGVPRITGPGPRRGAAAGWWRSGGETGSTSRRREIQCLTVLAIMAILRIYTKGGDRVRTKIQKWGNSQGVRLAKDLLADARLEVGDEVDVSTENDVVMIKPVKTARGRHNLEDLVARIPEEYQAEEVNWGEPVGKEVW